MTLSRTATTASMATSVSATAVTTSTMLDLPLAMARVWVSDFLPASLTAPIASLSTEAKLVSLLLSAAGGRASADEGSAASRAILA